MSATRASGPLAESGGGGRRHARRRHARVFLALIALTLAVAALSLTVGAVHLDLAKALAEPASQDGVILLQARLPRVALGLVTGGALAAVGVAFQALLRNPLADPYILGVSGGAAMGATLAMLLGATTVTLLGATLVPLAALGGALGAVLLVYALARASGDVSGTTIVLAGAIVNAIASASVTLAKTLVSAQKSQELLYWLVGFLEVPSLPALFVVSVAVAVGLAALFLDSGRLNLLSLGREPAAHLGLEVHAVERRLFFLASLIVGAVVSLTGLIGFVGLIAPHATRRLVGSDHRVLLPAAALLGGAMLTACDLVARAAFLWLGSEPPVGAVTALLGGPLFLVLLYQTRRRVVAV